MDALEAAITHDQYLIPDSDLMGDRGDDVLDPGENGCPRP